MFRTIIVSLFCLSCHPGFSQQKDFDRFIAEVDSCRAQNKTVIYLDTLFQKQDYELKWTHISGTYGGSSYCCGGEAFHADSDADTLLYINDIYLFGLRSNRPGCSVELIGDRYLVETFVYEEPRSTSAIHYIYVVRYNVVRGE